MTIDKQGPEGIHAKRIQADNVVSGIQIQGGDPAQSAHLVQFAQAIRRGEVSAEDISASSIVSGLQYIADPATAGIDDLRRELTAFRAKLDQVIAAQELPTKDDEQDANESLRLAEAELAKSQPNRQRVLRKLDEVNVIVTKSAEIAQASGKIGAFVVQLAPIAATLWQIAYRVLGL
jgi:hypothetical protein